jgi:hypothetical protein
MWALAIGALAGAVYNGVSTYMNNQKLAGAYSDYADAVKTAADKYSGKNAERAMQNAGEMSANNLGVQDWSAASREGVDPYHMNLQNRTAEGYNLGSGVKSQDLNARYNADTAKANAALKQAGVDFGVNNQLQQTTMNTAGGLADLYKNTVSGTGKKRGAQNSGTQSGTGTNGGAQNSGTQQ